MLRFLKESLTYTDQTYNDLVKMNQQGFNEETDVDQMKIGQIKYSDSYYFTRITEGNLTETSEIPAWDGFDQQILLTDSLPAIIEQGNIQYLSSPEFNVKNSIDYR